MPIIEREKTNANRRELTYHSPALEPADFEVKLTRPMVGGFVRTCNRQLIIKLRRNMMGLEDYKRYSDEALVGLAQNDDKAAFGELVKRYGDYIYKLCYNYLKNHLDAADYTQETFLSAWQNIKGFEGKSTFKTWITSIARNKCLNHLRGARLIEEIDPNIASNALRPDQIVEIKERVRILHEAIDKLQPQYRECIILYYFFGYKIAEIAEQLNCSEGAVKSRLFKARRKLGQALKNIPR
jgi:RNA polymerase sigma-70 factor (ECF subfamily)